MLKSGKSTSTATSGFRSFAAFFRIVKVFRNIGRARPISGSPTIDRLSARMIGSTPTDRIFSPAAPKKLMSRGPTLSVSACTSFDAWRSPDASPATTMMLYFRSDIDCLIVRRVSHADRDLSIRELQPFANSCASKALSFLICARILPAVACRSPGLYLKCELCS
jgi:hypothetical protein